MVTRLTTTGCYAMADVPKRSTDRIVGIGRMLPAQIVLDLGATVDGGKRSEQRLGRRCAETACGQGTVT